MEFRRSKAIRFWNATRLSDYLTARQRNKERACDESHARSIGENLFNS